MKNNRLFGIIYLLLSKEKMTAQELADTFEVSTRTIYRDIESLSEMNLPIYMSQGKNGGISLLKNYKFDKTLLSDEEQKQILFSLQGIHQLQIDNQSIYEKMKNFFSRNDENWFEVDFSVWGNSKIHQESFEFIKEAILNQHVIEFSYFNSQGIHTQRKVEPLKLCFRHNAWYLYAYDQEKEAPRFFKIMRIKDLKQSNEGFERKKDLSEELMEKQPFPVIKLLIQVDQKMSYRVYDEFEESSIQKLENGDFLVSGEFPMNDWVYGYILSFGEHVKVLEPENIRNEIIEKIKKTLQLYS